MLINPMEIEYQRERYQDMQRQAEHQSWLRRIRKAKAERNNYHTSAPVNANITEYPELGTSSPCIGQQSDQVAAS